MMRAGQIGSRGSLFTDYEDTWHTDLEEPNDSTWDDKGRNVISHIYVSFDKVIRSIQFGYLENGALVLSERYGSSPSDGHNFRVLRLNQDEYLTGLSGVVIGQGLFQEIKSLTFRTNRGEQLIGLYDNCASDRKVDIDLAICDPREFGGFFGSYSVSGLTSIGMYLNPIVGSSGQMVIKPERT